ncbi:MAG: TonB-dependent receptor [Bacteroidales bacterium]
MHNILKVIIYMLIPLFSHSQELVKGVVYGSEQDTDTPLTGVNIYWLGTVSGTVSNAEGEFVIPANTTTDSLIFRFVGYMPDTVDVSTAPNPFSITLFSENELEEVIVSARASGSHISRMETINMQQVTGEELHKAACCNLSESFSTNSSVDVSFSDAVTGAKQIQLLGLSGNYVQMQTENIPNFYGLAKSFGMEYIPGNWMESISISRGAASVLNGYQSITGQINVEYKKPQNSEKLFINLYANDAQKFEFNANGAAHVSDKLSTMVLAHTSYNNHKIDHNQDGFIDLPLLRQHNIFNRWFYQGSDDYTMQVGIKYFDETRLGGQKEYDHSQNADNPNLYGIDIRTSRLEGFMKHGYVFNEEKEQSLGWISSAALHNQTSLFGQTHYSGDQQSIYSNLIFSTALGKPHKHTEGELSHLVAEESEEQHQDHGDHQEHTDHSNHDHNEEAEHEHQTHPDESHDHSRLKHNINTGLSLQYDQYQETLDSSNYTTEEIVPGAFFEYTMQQEDKYTLIAGLRADHHNTYGLFVTPRSHFKVNFTKNLMVRLSAGKGFRSPRVLAENNVLLASSRDIIIEQNMEMEEAWNYGLSLIHYSDIFERELMISADYYRTSFINQIVVDMDTRVDQVSFYNLDGKSYANNYQLQLDYELIKNLDLTAAIRFTDVRTTYGGKLMKRPLNSDYKGLLTASYATPNQNWQFDVTTQFNGGGRIPSTSALAEQYQRPEKFDPYTIMNLQITYMINMFEIYAGVENVTDFTQQNPVIAPSEPYGSAFDASMIWGPIHGRKIYAGVRFSIN